MNARRWQWIALVLVAAVFLSWLAQRLGEPRLTGKPRASVAPQADVTRAIGQALEETPGASIESVEPGPRSPSSRQDLDGNPHQPEADEQEAARAGAAAPVGFSSTQTPKTEPMGYLLVEGHACIAGSRGDSQFGSHPDRTTLKSWDEYQHVLERWKLERREIIPLQPIAAAAGSRFQVAFGRKQDSPQEPVTWSRHLSAPDGRSSGNVWQLGPEPESVDPNFTGTLLTFHLWSNLSWVIGYYDLEAGQPVSLGPSSGVHDPHEEPLHFIKLAGTLRLEVLLTFKPLTTEEFRELADTAP